MALTVFNRERYHHQFPMIWHGEVIRIFAVGEAVFWLFDN
jgi:hypothetical protein